MADFHKKTKNPYRHFFIKLGTLVILLLAGALIVADVKIYQKKKELDAQVLGLVQKVETLKSQNAKTKEGMAREDDPVYIEKVAREDLDLQKPGEKVFSFVLPPGQKQTAAAPQNTWTAWVGNAWSSFISIFKK